MTKQAPVIIKASSIAVGEIDNDNVVLHRTCYHDEPRNIKQSNNVVKASEEQKGKQSSSHHFGLFHHHNHNRHNDDNDPNQHQHRHHHLHNPFQHHHAGHVPTAAELKQKAINGELQKEELHLSQRFPSATSEEIRRFLIGRDGSVTEAETKLCKYFDWKKMIGLEDDQNWNEDKKRNDDDDDWNRAARLALALSSDDDQTPPSSTTSDASTPTSTTDDAKISSLQPTITTLPRLVHLYYTHPKEEKENTPKKTILTDFENTKTLQVTPARLNLSLAPPSTYALAVALYLHYKFSPHSLEKMTVLIDLRDHDTWSNPTPKQSLPFIQIVVKLLGDYYPERMKRTIIFPLPKAATMIWNLVKRVFLEKNMVKKIVVIGASSSSSSSHHLGDTKRGGGIPKQLEEYFDFETLQGLECNRDR